MILPRFGITDRGWLVGVLLAVLVVASIEPFEIPGAPPKGPENDIFRWFLQIPAFLGGIGLLMTHRGWAARMMASPARWIAAFVAWQLLVAPVAFKPLAATVLSMGFAAYVGIGVLLVSKQGWDGARGYLMFLLAFILLASTALLVTGQAGALRLNGIMSHPNHLGGACGLAMILFFAKFLRGANWALGFFFLAGALLYLTDSRTAMAGTGIALLVVVSNYLPQGTILVIIGLIFTLALLVTQTDLLTSSTESLSRSGSETELATLTGRTDIWDISVGAIATEPVTGYGPGSTTDLFKEIKPEGVLGSFEINHAHNLWLQLGLIGGIPSMLLVTFGFLGYVMGTRGERILDRDAVVLAIAVFGISEPVISAEPNIFIVALAAATASVGFTSRSSQSQPITRAAERSLQPA